MDYNLIENKMKERIEYLDNEFSAIRAGRANPQILNKVMVEYYGIATPLNQVAAISVPEPRQIMITPWDKTLLGEINKALQVADLGINPMNDGNGIRLTFPELNEERRKEIVKSIKTMGEETKVSIRNIRREFIDDAKKQEKSSEISEDELRVIEEKIQKATDKYIEKIDKLVVMKSEEIMEV
ncbi:MAG: ribosome recycling factor [Clostridia bacterium]|nr:ribosome recycling factor [Clostridia bacterium]MDD4375964.1 ribosome recycling factor [Clostridia bacterium]